MLLKTYYCLYGVFCGISAVYSMVSVLLLPSFMRNKIICHELFVYLYLKRLNGVERNPLLYYSSLQ